MGSCSLPPALWPPGNTTPGLFPGGRRSKGANPKALRGATSSSNSGDVPWPRKQGSKVPAWNQPGRPRCRSCRAPSRCPAAHTVPPAPGAEAPRPPAACPAPAARRPARARGPSAGAPAPRSGAPAARPAASSPAQRGCRGNRGAPALPPTQGPGPSGSEASSWRAQRTAWSQGLHPHSRRGRPGRGGGHPAGASSRPSWPAPLPEGEAATDQGPLAQHGGRCRPREDCRVRGDGVPGAAAAAQSPPRRSPTAAAEPDRAPRTAELSPAAKGCRGALAGYLGVLAYQLWGTVFGG